MFRDGLSVESRTQNLEARKYQNDLGLRQFEVHTQVITESIVVNCDRMTEDCGRKTQREEQNLNVSGTTESILTIPHKKEVERKKMHVIVINFYFTCMGVLLECKTMSYMHSAPAGSQMVVNYHMDAVN